MLEKISNSFQWLIKFKENKWSWSLLASAQVFLVGCALFFQHYMLLEPCVLCIDQRIGSIGIALAAIIPLIFGLKNKMVKLFVYPLWLISASYGLHATLLQWYETHMSRVKPFFMSQCGQGLEVYFPWIEDYKILSDVFIARGICTEIDWSFLGLEMHHYNTIFFSLFLLAGVFYTITSIVQTIKEKKAGK